MLDVSKAIQESDIPGKIIKANENFFVKKFVFILTNHQKMVNFLIVKNQRISHQVSNQAHVHQKITIDQLVFSLFFQRYLKGYLVDNFQSFLIIYFINVNVVLERLMKLNIAYYECLKFGKELLTLIKHSSFSL